MTLLFSEAIVRVFYSRYPSKFRRFPNDILFVICTQLDTHKLYGFENFPN